MDHPTQKQSAAIQLKQPAVVLQTHFFCHFKRKFLRFYAIK